MKWEVKNVKSVNCRVISKKGRLRVPIYREEISYFSKES